MIPVSPSEVQIDTIPVEQGYSPYGHFKTLEEFRDFMYFLKEDGLGMLNFNIDWSESSQTPSKILREEIITQKKLFDADNIIILAVIAGVAESLYRAIEDTTLEIETSHKDTFNFNKRDRLIQLLTNLGHINIPLKLCNEAIYFYNIYLEALENVPSQLDSREKKIELKMKENDFHKNIIQLVTFLANYAFYPEATWNPNTKPIPFNWNIYLFTPLNLTSE